MSGQPSVMTKQQYRRVADDLRMRIIAGEWALNTPIPSRRALALEYGVALNTVGQAVSMLMTEGLLRADGRRSTLVAGAHAANMAGVEVRQGAARQQLQATIGIIATVYPYPNSEQHDTQWAYRALLGCEAVLADEINVILQYYHHAPSLAAADAQLRTWLASMLEAGLDALIVIQQDSRIEDCLQPVVDVGIPLICVTTDFPTLQATLVTYDQVETGYQAAQHLLHRGYRDLVFWAPVHLPWVEERLHGISRALTRSQGDAVTLTTVPHAPGDLETVIADFTGYAYQEALTLLPTIPHGAGIIAMNDEIAAGILQAAHALGLVVGRDFGLLGFDDYPLARQLGLTSLRPPMEAMGQTAARIVLDGLRHNLLAPASIALRSTLIPRASSSLIVAESHFDAKGAPVEITQ